MSGPLGIGKNNLIFQSPDSEQYAAITTNLANQLTINGDSRSSKCLLINLLNPVQDDHAATKSYVDAQITAAALGTFTIETEDLADFAVGHGQLAIGAVTSTRLADGAVTQSKIANGAVIASKIQDGVIGATKVNTDHILVTTSIAQSKTGPLSITDGTQSTSIDTGCLKLSGGLGITKDVFCAGSMHSSSFKTTSDRRLKKNIKNVSPSVCKQITDKVKVYSYAYKSDHEEKRHYGVMAQDLLLSNNLRDSVHENSRGEYSVEYNNIVSLLIGSVQELSKRIEKLEN